MGEKSGIDLVVEFAGTDISSNARSYEITEAKGESEKIDVTHKGDTARQHLLGLQGAENTTVTVTALYVDGGSDPIAALTKGTKGTLSMYPTGKDAGEDVDELTNAELVDRDKKVPYDGAIEWTLTFNSVDAMNYTTYTTA